MIYAETIQKEEKYILSGPHHHCYNELMYLLCGEPNIGKSTAIATLIDLLGPKRCSGFYTREILEGKQRVGFQTFVLHGGDFTFAHIDLPKTYAIEGFGVDVAAFERIVPDLIRNRGDGYLIIDEIGPMQLFSPAFKQLLLSLSSDDKVIATICQNDTDLTAALKERNRDRLFEIDENNRDLMPFILAEKLNADDPVYLSKLALSEKYHKEVERFSYSQDRILLRSTHDIRIIQKENGHYTCTCDYFKEKDTCSHIMAVIRNSIFWKY